MKSVMFGVALSLAFVGTSAAGDWRFVGIGDDFAAGVDFSRMTRTGTSVRTWVINSGVDRYELLLTDFECNASTMTVVSSALYDNNSTLLQSHSRAYAPIVVTPDSVGESTLNAACRNSPSSLRGLRDSYDRASEFHQDAGMQLFK